MALIVESNRQVAQCLQQPALKAVDSATSYPVSRVHSLLGMSKTEVDPIDLSAFQSLSKDELAKLQANPLIVAGIWEQSPQGKKLFEEQAKQAKANVQQAQDVQKQITNVEKLRSKLKDLEKSLDARYDDWQQAEAEMTSALLPFTPQGLGKDLERLVHESDQIAKGLEQSFTNDKSVDLATFLKEYEEQQVLRHTRKLKLASI